MKTLISTLALVVLMASASLAQIHKAADGKYYDAQEKLYTGPYTEHHANGQLKLKMNLNNGLKDGTVELFYADGTQQEIRGYAMGQKDGKWCIWSPKGQKTSEAYYRQGKKHGNWRVWDTTGKIVADIHYEDGKKVGTWKVVEGGAVAEKVY